MGNYIASMITNACNVAKSGAIPPTLRLESVVEDFKIQSHFAQTTFHRHRLYYDGRPGTALALIRRPVASITSVTEDGQNLTTDDYEVDSNLLYRLSSDQRIHWARREVVVTYAAGWEVVPDDLKYAAIKFVQDEISRGARDRYLKARTVPGVLEQQWWVDPTRDSMIPPEVYAILETGGYVNKFGWMA